MQKAEGKKTKKLFVPVRISLIGEWSDQTSWPHRAAVTNAAVGWESCFNGHYPIMLHNRKIHSKVKGIGTGLGISSILEAARFLHDNPDGDYIQHVLSWEESIGVKGGWQDQIGGVTPGFKLITTEDHKNFVIQNRDDHPMFENLILFDTGVRRPSKSIGDRIRAMFGNKKFDDALLKVVDMQKETFWGDADTFAKACIESWKSLNRFIDIDVEVPKTDLAHGHRLVGSGGGGFGIIFAKNKENRKEILQMMKKAGYWAVEPVLLNGIKVEEGSPSLAVKTNEN